MVRTDDDYLNELNRKKEAWASLVRRCQLRQGGQARLPIELSPSEVDAILQAEDAFTVYRKMAKKDADHETPNSTVFVVRNDAPPSTARNDIAYVQRLRAALKRLWRDHGLKCVSCLSYRIEERM